jgi:hypothetical protein
MKNILDDYAWHCVRGGKKQIQNLLDLGFIFPSAYRYDIGNICESKEKGLPIVGPSAVFKEAVREIIRMEKERGAPAREMYKKLLRKVGLKQEWAGTAFGCADILAGDHWNVFLAFGEKREFKHCSTDHIGFRVRDLVEMGAKFRTNDLYPDYVEVLDAYATGDDLITAESLADEIVDHLKGIAYQYTRGINEADWGYEEDMDYPSEVVCNFPVPIDLAVKVEKGS